MNFKSCLLALMSLVSLPLLAQAAAIAVDTTTESTEQATICSNVNVLYVPSPYQSVGFGGIGPDIGDQFFNAISVAAQVTLPWVGFSFTNVVSSGPAHLRALSGNQDLAWGHELAARIATVSAVCPHTKFIFIGDRDGASIIHTASAVLIAHETIFSSWITDASLIFTFRENLSTYATIWPSLWSGRHFGYCNQSSSFGIPFIPPFPVCFGQFTVATNIIVKTVGGWWPAAL